MEPIFFCFYKFYNINFQTIEPGFFFNSGIGTNFFFFFASSQAGKLFFKKTPPPSCLFNGRSLTFMQKDPFLKMWFYKYSVSKLIAIACSFSRIHNFSH